MTTVAEGVRGQVSGDRKGGPTYASEYYSRDSQGAGEISKTSNLFMQTS